MCGSNQNAGKRGEVGGVQEEVFRLSGHECWSVSNQREKHNKQSRQQIINIKGRDVTRITVYVLYTVYWKHLEILTVLYQNVLIF